MSKNVNYQRLEFHQLMKYHHQMNFTENEIKTVESFFHESIKATIKKVMVFRFINIVTALFGLAGWVFLRNTENFKWMVLGMLAFFAVYNFAHIILNSFQYSKIKSPGKYEDDGR